MNLFGILLITHAVSGMSISFNSLTSRSESYSTSNNSNYSNIVIDFNSSLKVNFKNNIHINRTNVRSLRSGGHSGGHSSSSGSTHTSSHYSTSHYYYHSGPILNQNVLSSVIIFELININQFPYYDNILILSNQTYLCKFNFELNPYNESQFRELLESSDDQQVANHIKVKCYKQYNLDSMTIIIIMLIFTIIICFAASNCGSDSYRTRMM